MAPFPALADPRLVLRLVDQVAAGNRRPRGLAEVLDVEVRAVEQAVRAARWLGLLREGEIVALSDAGLRLAYAGGRRAREYAQVIRRHPFLAPLLPARGPVDLDVLTAAVRAADADLTAVAARRRAGVLRRLAEPGLRVRLPPTAGEQLGLGFAAPSSVTRSQVDLRAGTEENPDVYLLLLDALLDAGELTTAQVRAVLDTNGADGCPVGAPIAMAVRRGDAVREGDRLIVTRGAVARREVAGSAVTVALSDPEFRAWVAAARDGPAPGGRMRLWADRLFRPGPVDGNVDRLLFGRPLASVPLAAEPGDPLPPPPGPFLDAPTHAPRALAFPRSLSDLVGGVAAVNRGLRQQHMEPAAVRLPAATDPRVRVSGGIFTPGEVPARSVADGVSLRHRVVTHAPAFALLVAAGILERRRAVRLFLRRDAVQVEVPRRGGRPFSGMTAAVAAACGWVVVTGPDGPDWATIATTGVALGLLTTVGDRLTLEEGFFQRLQADPEHRHLWESLQPLVSVIADATLPALAG